MNQFLFFTRSHLTTTAMASYVLESCRQPHPSRILFLSGSIPPDYLRCLLFHGLRTQMGPRCHDYPRIPHMYTGHETLPYLMWGRGYTYSGLLPPESRNRALDDSVEQDLRDKKYDLVVYGSYHRGMPLYSLVRQYYEPSKVLLFCGEDTHRCDYEEWISRGHYVFVRELVE